MSEFYEHDDDTYADERAEWQAMRDAEDGGGHRRVGGVPYPIEDLPSEDEL